MKKNRITQEKLSEMSGLSCSTVRNVQRGEHVYGKTMQAIANALDVDPARFFEQIGAPVSLSGATVQYYHHILRSMFTTAVYWQIIPANPCEKVKPPKKERKEAIYLEEEDTVRLLECLNSVDVFYKVLITLYVFTGMRKGEALGLTWKDVDFGKNLIDINKELVYVHKVGVKIDTPKNESSKRVIKVPPLVTELLHEWKVVQEGYKQLYGDLYVDQNFIFTNKIGKPIHPDSISSWFGKFVKEHDLPPIHIHSLRHTNASIMIANGVDVKTVSKRLGHADTQTTITIYTHQLRTADEAAAEMLDMRIGRKKRTEDHDE